MEVGDWWQQVVNTIENTTHAIPTSRPGRLAVFPGSHVHLAINTIQHRKLGLKIYQSYPDKFNHAIGGKVS